MKEMPLLPCNGMFNKFRATFSTGYIYWGEYRTGLWADGLAGQTARDQVYQNQIPTNHSYANWADLYTTINNANLILKYTPDIAFNSEDAKTRFSKRILCKSILLLLDRAYLGRCPHIAGRI